MQYNAIRRHTTNVALLVGRLTRDPESRVTSTSKTVTKLSVATNEFFDGKEHVEYHSVIAWEKLAESVAKLTKGEMVTVQGRLSTRKWTDKDGVERKTTEVVASRIDFMKPPRVEEPATF